MFKKRSVFLVLLLVVLCTLNVYAGEIKQDSRIQFFCIASNIELEETDEIMSGFKVGQDLSILIDNPTKKLRSASLGNQYDLILVMDYKQLSFDQSSLYTLQISIDEHVIFELKSYNPLLKGELVVPSGLRQTLLDKGIVVEQPDNVEGSFAVFIDDELIHREKLWFQI